MLSAKKQTINVIARRMSQHVNRASPMVDKFVRVDHAGELGADRIYAGQMAILGKQIDSCFIFIFHISYLIFKATQKLVQQSSTCGNKRKFIDTKWKD